MFSVISFQSSPFLRGLFCYFPLTEDQVSLAANASSVMSFYEDMLYRLPALCSYSKWFIFRAQEILKDYAQLLQKSHRCLLLECLTLFLRWCLWRSWNTRRRSQSFHVNLNLLKQTFTKVETPSPDVNVDICDNFKFNSVRLFTCLLDITEANYKVITSKIKKQIKLIQTNKRQKGQLV
jgi:hypothetical protein